jgi:hypothetical protein
MYYTRSDLDRPFGRIYVRRLQATRPSHGKRATRWLRPEPSHSPVAEFLFQSPDQGIEIAPSRGKQVGEKEGSLAACPSQDALDVSRSAGADDMTIESPRIFGRKLFRRGIHRPTPATEDRYSQRHL